MALSPTNCAVALETMLADTPTPSTCFPTAFFVIVLLQHTVFVEEFVPHVATEIGAAPRKILAEA
eukprot:COSAG02_NODE_2765_length_8068_cov_6.824319_2_plen_65_part_00